MLLKIPAKNYAQAIACAFYRVNCEYCWERNHFRNRRWSSTNLITCQKQGLKRKATKLASRNFESNSRCSHCNESTPIPIDFPGCKSFQIHHLPSVRLYNRYGCYNSKHALEGGSTIKVPRLCLSKNHPSEYKLSCGELTSSPVRKPGPSDLRLAS